MRADLSAKTRAPLTSSSTMTTKATSLASTCHHRRPRNSSNLLLLPLAPRRNCPSIVAAAAAKPRSRSTEASSSSSASAAAAAASAAAGAAAAEAPPRLPSSSSPSPSSSLSSSPSPSPSSPSQPPPPFSWTAHWYPVAFVGDLPTDVPTPFTLLGTRLAIYFEGETGRWVALEDSCPHRRAPLSQGRILRDKKKGDKTTLECSYHGWQFEGSRGGCTFVPQLDGTPSLVPEAAARAATRSPRACAVPRPTRVAQGMLWVWGQGPSESSGQRGAGGAAAVDDDEEGGGGGEDPVSRMFREADEKEPLYAPGISLDDYNVASDAKDPKSERLLTLAGRYTRDVEYDATTLMDNLLDTSHLAFAHNRVLGDRDADDAGDVAVARVPYDPETGLEVGAETPALSSVRATVTFGGGSDDDGKEKEAGQQQHRYLDTRSASARALRTEALTGDAATFEASFRVPRSDGDGRAVQRVVFEPPCLSFWMIDDSPDPVVRGSRWRNMPIYVVPTEPGRCRILFQIRYPDSPKLNKVITFVVNKLTPEWVSHCRSSQVTDGDSRLLWPTEARAREAIDAALSASSASSASASPPVSVEDIGRAFFKTNYMPAPADAPIVAYRKWLFSRGGGGPFGSPFATSPLLRSSSFSSSSSSSSFSRSSSSVPEQRALASVLSRYEGHTKNCKSCSGALRNAVALKKVGAVAALVLASAAAGAVGARAPVAAVARWGVASAVAALVSWGASRAERSLTYTGYDHSRVH